MVWTPCLIISIHLPLTFYDNIAGLSLHLSDIIILVQGVLGNSQTRSSRTFLIMQTGNECVGQRSKQNEEIMIKGLTNTAKDVNAFIFIKRAEETSRWCETALIPVQAKLV